jgi:hypothetical protein
LDQVVTGLALRTGIWELSLNDIDELNEKFLEFLTISLNWKIVLSNPKSMRSICSLCDAI